MNIGKIKGYAHTRYKEDIKSRPKLTPEQEFIRTDFERLGNAFSFFHNMFYNVFDLSRTTTNKITEGFF